MTPKEIRDENLTRWNRAGLEYFRYVDGNAVTFLENVRSGLATAFPAWDKVNEKIPPGENPAERQVRIVKQYGAPRREWAWEIARTFARATHILTEHVNAFANEGYIATATQWEYLRRLVTMLDYHPRPPASASTTLVLIAKSDKGIGTVNAGFQVKYSPTDGNPPVVFETLDAIELDPRLNEVRLAAWNHNPATFDAFAPHGATTVLWALPKDAKVSVGEPGVLLDKVGAVAVKIGWIADDRSALDLLPPTDRARVRGDTHLYLEPDKVYVPHLNGVGVMKVGERHKFAAGQIIGWKSGSTLGFTRVVAVDRQSIQVSGTVPAGTDITQANVQLYTTGEISHDQFLANSSEWRFPADKTAANFPLFRIAAIAADGVIQSALKAAGDLLDNPPGSVAKGYRTLSVTADSLRFFDATNDQPVAQTLAKSANTLLDVDGGVGLLKSGAYLVAEDKAQAREAVLVKRAVAREDSFTIELAQLPAALQNVVRLYGPFVRDLRPSGYDRDPTTVAPAQLVLTFAGDDLPAGLTAGKTVVVEPEDAAASAQPFKATILDIVRPAGSEVNRLVLDATAQQWAGYARGNLIIRANAVAAGHGETKPGMTLGSGDAAQTSQSFLFKKEKVSFRADPTLSQGVRAAIDIVVADRHYDEVSTFADSEAADAHYTVHMTEEGYLEITFGDGFHGRRLPTGRNNIAISYRVGTGSAGNNLPPGSLEKEVKPNNFVDKIRQPLPTSGGQEMEDAGQVRRNAPAHLRTLDRGVSLADFEYLAGSQPGVWHAKAFSNPAGADRRELVELVVVPAGGAELGDLKQSLEQRLANLGPPGIVFKVSRFDPIPLKLRITLRVDTAAFDYAAVEKAVRDAVYQTFKLEARAPGRPIYRAEVYACVEAIAGVVNSDVSLFQGEADPIASQGGNSLRRVSRGALGEIWAVWPTERQAIYVTAPAAIAILSQEVIV